MIICVSIDVPLHAGHDVLFGIFILCFSFIYFFYLESKWMFYYSLNFFFLLTL